MPPCRRLISCVDKLPCFVLIHLLRTERQFVWGIPKKFGFFYCRGSIYLDGADAGMDGAEFDNADFDEGYVADPIIVLDNADWDAGDGQDAAPLGEEAMVW